MRTPSRTHLALRGLVATVAWCALAGPAMAGRTLDANTYADRLKGMWVGQLLGNYAGRPVEGRTTTYDGYDITEYPVKWDGPRSATWRCTSGSTGPSG